MESQQRQNNHLFSVRDGSSGSDVGHARLPGSARGGNVDTCQGLLSVAGNRTGRRRVGMSYAETTVGEACAVAPASYAQERLWLTEQVQQDNPVANVSAVVRLNSHLIIAALERSFAAIVQRHEVL